MSSRPALHGASLCALAFAAALAAAGCTTTMSGKRAGDDVAGIRYSLPAPHVYMNPQPDGTVEVEVKYLPDPQNTYTLNMDSYLSSATFDVKLADGMLTSVELDADSSSLTSASVKAATELKKQQMIAEDKKRDEKAKAAETSKTQAQAAADAMQKMEDELELLNLKFQFYKDNPTAASADEMLKLKLEIAQKELALSQLRARQAQSGDSASNAPRDAFSDPGAGDAGLEQAFGPVLFRVLPTSVGGVELVAIEQQRSYQTSTSAEAEKKPATAFAFTPSLVVVKATDTDQDVRFKTNKSITIDGSESALVRPSDGVNAPPVIRGEQLAVAVTDADAQSVRLVLPKDLPAGAYRLDLVFTVRGSSERQAESLAIRWLLD